VSTDLPTPFLTPTVCEQGVATKYEQISFCGNTILCDAYKNMSPSAENAEKKMDPEEASFEIRKASTKNEQTWPWSATVLPASLSLRVARVQVKSEDINGIA
jgi:hypothetical protein